MLTTENPFVFHNLFVDSTATMLHILTQNNAALVKFRNY